MQSLIDLCAEVLINNPRYLNFNLIVFDLHDQIIQKIRDRHHQIRASSELDSAIVFLRKFKQTPYTRIPKFFNSLIILKEHNVDVNLLISDEKLENIKYKLILGSRRLSYESYLSIIRYMNLEREWFANPQNILIRREIRSKFNIVCAKTSEEKRISLISEYNKLPQK